MGLSWASTIRPRIVWLASSRNSTGGRPALAVNDIRSGAWPGAWTVRMSAPGGTPGIVNRPSALVVTSMTGSWPRRSEPCATWCGDWPTGQVEHVAGYGDPIVAVASREGRHRRAARAGSLRADLPGPCGSSASTRGNVPSDRIPTISKAASLSFATVIARNTPAASSRAAAEAVAARARVATVAATSGPGMAADAASPPAASAVSRRPAPGRGE